MSPDSPVHASLVKVCNPRPSSACTATVDKWTGFIAKYPENQVYHHNLYVAESRASREERYVPWNSPTEKARPLKFFNPDLPMLQ